ncbi:TPA: hypothetical protein DEP34_01285 [Candidatus Uhrbacteria bacterium]|uniref:Uncharacterized protein n=2 Tax=Candidatus Uhriibacteriota TaxID=1752732 RepID=A0A0G1T530_9BACT|nr:MAG: hypothetical protein UX45_C0015G0019 [Candidatus Uhrbacteria bacterium GW2011_GWF2_46_218]KKU40520.1 MAG: hypothetical protein UX57_C0015G0007 [Candidatus Uhrbacteria bacterium GW2011_GWE2_46_68]HBK33611.1 hypothetical protein [Candidatus Uhrbacteria bacterium]HCB19005.1 hypothetical protein [Candidatus Uhrbacteria bacterium]
MSLAVPSIYTPPTLVDFLVYILRDWGCGKEDHRLEVKALVTHLFTRILFVNGLSIPSMMVIVDRKEDALQAQLADTLNIKTQGIVFYLHSDRPDYLYVVKLVHGVPWGMAYPLREVRDEFQQVIFSDPDGCRDFTKARVYSLGRYMFTIPSDYLSPRRPEQMRKDEEPTETFNVSESTRIGYWFWQ